MITISPFAEEQLHAQMQRLLSLDEPVRMCTIGR
jgi:hypothetical protein